MSVRDVIRRTMPERNSDMPASPQLSPESKRLERKPQTALSYLKLMGPSALQRHFFSIHLLEYPQKGLTSFRDYPAVWVFDDVNRYVLTSPADLRRGCTGPVAAGYPQSTVRSAELR